jgi:hypothetical protein
VEKYLNGKKIFRNELTFYKGKNKLLKNNVNRLEKKMTNFIETFHYYEKIEKKVPVVYK